MLDDATWAQTKAAYQHGQGRSVPRPTRWLRLAAILAVAVFVLGSGCTRASAGRAPRQRAHGHYAAINGIRVYYEDRGHGPALFLLHGGVGNGMQFDQQAPVFQKSHRVIVPDACAQGRTSDRADSLTYHAMAEDVVGLMDHLHIKRADIMGWSDGGVTALDVAMNHPDRVDHIVTFGANFRPDGLNLPDILWNKTATADSFGADMKKGYEELAPDPGHYAISMNRVIALWRDQPNYTEADLGKIRAKVLIAAGEHDVIRQDHTEALAHAIPGATLWIVPGGSHSVMQEQPEVVNRRVLEFLGH